MKSSKRMLLYAIAAASIGSLAVSCNDSKSYAELLTDENKNTNAFLANQRVVNSVPEDSVFEVGPNAPYYRMDEEGNVYMQVLNTGDGNKPKDDAQVYFRYLRYDLSNYAATDTLGVAMGNANDMEYDATWFRFNNYSLSASSQYGAGIQVPMNYFGMGCEVNMVIKSQYGFTSEVSMVIPFLYNVRYFKSPI